MTLRGMLNKAIAESLAAHETSEARDSRIARIALDWAKKEPLTVADYLDADWPKALAAQVVAHVKALADGKSREEAEAISNAAFTAADPATVTFPFGGPAGNVLSLAVAPNPGPMKTFLVNGANLAGLRESAREYLTAIEGAVSPEGATRYETARENFHKLVVHYAQTVAEALSTDPPGQPREWTPTNYGVTSSQ